MNWRPGRVTRLSRNVVSGLHPQQLVPLHSRIFRLYVVQNCTLYKVDGRLIFRSNAYANCCGSESLPGYVQCVFLAPDVFRLNGEEALMYDPNPDDAKRRLLRAATACPVQAIAVDRVEAKIGAAS